MVTSECSKADQESFELEWRQVALTVTDILKTLVKSQKLCEKQIKAVSSVIELVEELDKQCQ